MNCGVRLETLHSQEDDENSSIVDIGSKSEGGNGNEKKSSSSKHRRSSHVDKSNGNPFKQCLSPSNDTISINSETNNSILNETSSNNYKPKQLDPTSLKKLQRNKDILRQLGIIHLDGKVTRVKCEEEETEEGIMREAGLSYFNVNDLATVKTVSSNKEKCKYQAVSMKEARILKEAGVTWMDSTIPSCETNTTATNSYTAEECATTNSSTLFHNSSSNNNYTYAEKELMRRLEHGWATTGAECDECGMPVIFRKRVGGLEECVICGVLEENEVDDGAEHGVDVKGEEEITGHLDRIQEEVEQMTLQEGGGTNTNMRTITPSWDNHNEQGDINPIDEAMLKEELGRRLFSGWTMLNLSCPSCNLPLIVEKGTKMNGSDGGVCLRCG